CWARRARWATSAFTHRPLHRRTDAGRVMNSQGTLLGILAVLGAAALWGTTGTAATFAPDVGPLAMGAAALGFGGMLQALIALPALYRARYELRAHFRIVLAGAVGAFIYPLAFYSSMHLAGVAVGTVVSLGSAPIASEVLARVSEIRHLSRRWMLGAALSITGATSVCLSSMHNAPSQVAPTIAGIALGLVAGTTYALCSWNAHHLIGRSIGRAA